MKLKAKYKTREEIPVGYEDLYEERGGEWLLVGIEGVRTDADIQRLQTSLTAERAAHTETKTKLKTFEQALGGQSAEEVVAKLDRIAELESAAGGKVDEAKLNELAEGRVKSRLAPVERERDQLKEKLADAEKKIAEFIGREKTRSLHDAVRAKVGQMLEPTAVEDALFLAERHFEVDDSGTILTKEGVGVTPGVGPDVWVTEMQKNRPHWFKQTTGGGLVGGRNSKGVPSNPWTAENWNMTQQAQIVKDDPAKAEQLAKAAGTTIGGRRPVATQKASA